ncbi:MAG: glycosyltransferase family 2 protein [Steroidobacteraceae bacterium]|jgi:cellulose synthase/poly-beta-1,6-N-acetylglucosamine synthase-like glycosyltransferase
MALIDLALYATLAALALAALVPCAYLFTQTLMSGRLRTPLPVSRRLRFDLVVPAYNEAQAIAATVANLLQIDWPRDQYRILVVADNCTDATAAMAAAAGATVLERQDLSQRGKGYALRFAFQRSHEDGRADAVVVIDADSLVSSNLLEAFAARIEQGAHAVQAHHGVLNPGRAWRTRLLAIAIAANHVVRSRARERAQLSSGIRGNGWCVTHALLQKVEYNAFSLAEDLEFGIDLGLNGFRVYYAGEAHASQEMVADAKTARKQRQRWEHGRFHLIRTRTLPLLRAALKHRSAVCLDLALDLIVLPLSYVALNVGALLLVSVLAARWNPAFHGWVWLSLLCTATLVLYVARGWQLSGTGARGLLDLAGAPFFVVWKVILMLERRRSTEWIRTDRKAS